MTIALFSWLGSASVLSRSPDFPLFLLMFYAEKWPPSSVIVLHLMTHSTAASSYYPNVKVWTPLLEGLKKVFICTPLSAGNKKNWLMENAKLLKRFCADEPNPRHCCKKNRSKTKEDSYKYWWSLWPLEYQIVHLAFIYTLPLVHIGVSAKEQSHKSSDFYESSWTVMGQDLGPH